jgi:hypothetical protein
MITSFLYIVYIHIKPQIFNKLYRESEDISWPSLLKILLTRTNSFGSFSSQSLYYKYIICDLRFWTNNYDLFKKLIDFFLVHQYMTKSVKWAFGIWHKVFKKSSLKPLDQFQSKCVWIINRASSFKIIFDDPASHQMSFLSQYLFLQTNWQVVHQPPNSLNTTMVKLIICWFPYFFIF